MKWHLRGRTLKRLRTATSFALAYVLVGIVWEYLELSQVSFYGPGIGLAVGLTLAVLEESDVAGFTRRMSFSAAVLTKSVIYLAFIAVPLGVMGFIGGALSGLELSDFYAWILSAEFIRDIVLLYAIHLGFLFFRQLSGLLGPGTMVRYVTGRYHKPRVEKRVFMFLDLKSSTTLAENLGGARYYAFLNEFFHDLSDPIMDRRAEIYRFVGDEVILTWPLSCGVRDANCVRVFVEIMAQIHGRREYYLNAFGHVPEFKAGVHYGEVVTAEIGDVKKEISYLGDVLNTTARIQSKCNEMGQLLIASQELVDELELPEYVQPQPLGQIALRGKAHTTALVGLHA